MKRIVLAILLCATQVAQAALPPTAESMRRIKAVMESHDVYDKLGSVNWIISVKETKEGYELASEKCTLQVSVSNEQNNKAPKMVGPQPLKVTVGDMLCQ